MNDFINIPEFNMGNTPKERLIWLESYFRRCSETEPQFLPELQATEKVNAILANNTVAEKDVRQLIEIYNETNKLEHYNGSGWSDFTFAIRSITQEYGFETIMLSDKSLLLTSCGNHLIPYQDVKITITGMKEFSKDSLALNVYRKILVNCSWDKEKTHENDEKLLILINSCATIRIYNQYPVILDGQIYPCYLENLERLLEENFLYKLQNKNSQFNN